MLAYTTSVPVTKGTHITEVPMSLAEAGDYSILPPRRGDLAVLECGHFDVKPICSVCGRASGSARYYPGVNAMIFNQKEGGQS